MEDKKDKLFLYKIYENNDGTGTLLFLNQVGKKVRLKAKGFFKENSVNYLKFKEFSFLEVEWIEYDDNVGLLKRGDIIFSQAIKNENQIIFMALVGEIINRTQNIRIEFYEFILKIFKDLNFYYDYKSIFIFICFLNFHNLNINFKINGCVFCNKNYKIKTFSFHSGGLICSECFDIRKHNQLGIDFTKKLIIATKIEEYDTFINISFTKEEIKILEKLLIDYYNNELGFYIDNLSKL